MKRIKLIAAGCAALLCVALTACGEKAGERNFTAVVRATESPGSAVFSNDTAVIDYSNAGDGYITAMYNGSNEKVKLQLTLQGGDTYTYDLNKRGVYDAFPLSQGDGSYKAAIYENVSGTKYSLLLGGVITVSMKDQNGPFLYPNQYVSYVEGDPVIALSEQLAQSCSTDLEVVETVFDYVTKDINYDYELAENIPTGYLPDLCTLLENKTGICFDYASLMTALLRCQNIPTKVIIGYVGTEYHAWISVYVDDIGWVDGIIRFDGSKWTRMDPTFASTGGSDKMLDDSLYNALYYF